ncbi:MAG: DUF2017 family protein [Candidatus Dormibacteria bacterium]
MAQVLRRRGRIQVKLDAREREALTSILDQLEPRIEETAAERSRAYDDADLQHEYDRWVSPEVQHGREADVAVVRDGLSAGEDTLPLTEAQALAWLRAFNHVRVAAGGLLGIKHDGWEKQLDAKSQKTLEYGALIALGYLQEELVAALES